MYVFLLVLSLALFIPVLVFQNKNHFIFIVTFVYLFILSLVFGLRYDVGIDYLNYEYYFNYHASSFKHEIGYSTLNYILYSMGLPFYTVTLLMSFATNYLSFFGVWFAGIRGPYFYLAVLLYASNFMLVSLNGMRQALAVAIIFAFITFIFKNKFLKFLISCLVAATFHLSAVGFILILGIKKYLESKKVIVLLYLLMIIIFLLVNFFKFNNFLIFLSQYIPYYSSLYLDGLSNVVSSSVGVGVSLRFALSSLLVFIFIFHFERYDKHEKFIVSLFLIGLIFNFMSVTNFMWGRVGMYFYIFEILAIPLIVRGLKDKVLRSFTFSLALLYSLLFMVAVIFSGETSNLTYKSVFD